MTDLAFSQPDRRNFLVPILIVTVLVAGVFTLVYLFTPHRMVDARVTHVGVQGKHFTYAGPTIGGVRVVGGDSSEDDLYVLVAVRVHDDLKLPLFIKDLTGMLTTQDGTGLTTSAVEKNDLGSVYEAFPSIKSISGPPLLRETEIAPGATAEGTVMLHYPATEAMWKQRKSAAVTIEFYHQDPITVPIPQQ